MLLEQLGIDHSVESSAFVHALLLDGPPQAVVTIDDDGDDDIGTCMCIHEELKRAKMENAKLRRRYARLRIKLASCGEDPRGVSTKCATYNGECSTVNFEATIPRASQP